MTIETVGGSVDLAAHVQNLLEQSRQLVQQNRLQECSSILDDLLAIEEQELTDADPSVAINVLDAAGVLVPTKAYGALSRIYVVAIQALARNERARPDDPVTGMYNLMAIADQAGEARTRDELGAQIVGIASRLEVVPSGATVRAFMDLANIYETNGNLEPVLVLYRPVHAYMMQTLSTTLEIRLGWLARYASLLFRAEKGPQAIELCELGLEHAASDDGAHNLWLLRFNALIGQHASRMGDTTRARTAFEQALPTAQSLEVDAPLESSAIYHNLGGLYLHLGSSELLDEAARFTQRALDLIEAQGLRNTSEYAGGQAHLGQIADKRGDIEAAAMHYDLCLETFDVATDHDAFEHAACLRDAGFLQLKRQDPKAAVQAFEKARVIAKILPEYSPLVESTDISNAATAHFEASHLEKSIELYTEAMDVRHQSEKFLAGEPILMHLSSRWQ